MPTLTQRHSTSGTKRHTTRHAPYTRPPSAGSDTHLSQKTLHSTPEERRAMGKAIRERCSRISLGEWRAAGNRRDPIDLLIESSQGRIESLVPIRYGRMVASPFAFYRGAASIMASDLATTASTGIHLQVCGDCHLANFGGFATPERKLAFDINDFDETTVGPWEWDIKRLCASLVVASRANGFAADDAREVAWRAASAYRDHISDYASMPLFDAWYDYIDLRDQIERSQDEEMKTLYTKSVRKATEHTAHTNEFAKLTVAGGIPARIKDEPPLIYHDNALMDEVSEEERTEAFANYRDSLSPERRIFLDRFDTVDTAVKVVGVGSVGTYCGVMLLLSGSGDPLFLQFKEARSSVLDPFVGENLYPHQGQRVVVGQRLMQSASDIFLGWTQGPKRQFYVRQLRDAKISPQIELMSFRNLRRYGKVCAHALARAHVRSGDAVLLAAYLGSSDAFADAIASFSVAYADQSERDHGAMIKAARAGRIDVASTI